jgi:SAM-dependent methyltransferase
MTKHTNKICAKLALKCQTFTESVLRMAYDFEDKFFEKWHRLELCGNVHNKDLIAQNKDSLSHATAYQAVWCRNLRELFKEANKTGYDFEIFVDIGSGKGKACFYANTKQSFNHIIGIEFSEPLVYIANKNKQIIKPNNIDFFCADATEFQLPNQTNLIFMFNPFDNVVLEKFISNNIAHFKAHNSVIAYANDIQRLSLTKFGFETIFRNQTRKISLYKLT